MSSETSFRFPVGSRIEAGGSRGTVKYAGEITSLSGSWLGIEWDDISRGKHDGSLHGTRYFDTRHPRSGSFLRPQKANPGSSLLEAVREKYQEATDSQEFTGHILGSKEIEFVGMEKIGSRQRRLDTLTQVVVESFTVSQAGSLEELSTVLRSCMELDVNDNLLWNWKEVFSIIQSLPRLRILNLSKNKFVPLTENDNLDPQGASKIEIMSLYDCDLCTNDVAILTRLFGELRDLGLCHNKIDNVQMAPGCMQNLKLLDLESNLDLDWHGLESVWFLPNLEVINLSRTNIGTISCKKHGMFPSLKLLYLSYNRIKDWDSINELNKLAKLSELMLQGNPVYEVGDKLTNRQLVVAKIGRLKFFNREIIMPTERRGAEIDYLKRFGLDWIRGNKKKDPTERAEVLSLFHDQHPRFGHLIERYGAPDETEMVAEMRPTGILKNQLLHVTIIGEGITDSARKIPSSMTVQKLKGLVGRLCKKNPRTLKLTYECRRRPGLFISLDNDCRELTFYSIEDGDTVHVAA